MIVILQSTLVDYIMIYNVKPNLILIFIVSVGLLRGNVEGAVIGVFMGLAWDVVSGKLLGFYALLGLFLGFLTGSVNKRLYRENFLVILFFTFVSTVGFEWAVYFLHTVFTSKIDFYYPFRYVILPEAIYNCGVSIFIYIFVIKLNDWFSSSKKISRKY